MKHRHIENSPIENFLNGESPVFVNRVYESFEISQHTHEFVEINFVSEGKGFHYIEDEVLPVVKGDLFLLPIGTSHVYRPDSAKPNHTFVIINCVFRYELLVFWQQFIPLSREIIDFLTPQQENRTKPWLQYKDSSGELVRIFEDLYKEYVQKTSNYQVLLSIRLIELLTLLNRYPFFNQTPAEVTTRLEEAFRYIQNHFHENLTLEQFTVMTNLSKSQFQRLFKKARGQTFTEYIQNLRIKKACQLLRTNSFTVQHIANLVGYEDLKFFHALFKKKTGNTPHQFRMIFIRDNMECIDTLRGSIRVGGNRRYTNV